MVKGDKETCVEHSYAHYSDSTIIFILLYVLFMFLWNHLKVNYTHNETWSLDTSACISKSKEIFLTQLEYHYHI